MFFRHLLLLPKLRAAIAGFRHRQLELSIPWISRFLSQFIPNPSLQSPAPSLQLLSDLKFDLCASQFRRNQPLSSKRFQHELLAMAFPFSLRYWTADHPSISAFHWDHNAFGSSWTFLAFSILSYLILIQILKLLLIFRRQPLPLGPVPALYNLILLLGSLIMFVGCWQSAAVEIEETRWLWRRSKTVWEWILCLPMGTRPAGRVFFWSYVFYITKYYEFLGTFIHILKKRSPTVGHVFRHIMVVIMCFLWLQFSQSLQILTLLSNTGLYVVMYLYFFLCSVGLAPRWKNVVRHCQIAQFVMMSLASIGLVRLHFVKSGCSGMGAWVFSAVLNASLLPFIFIMDRKRQSRSVCSISKDEATSNCKQD